LAPEAAIPTLGYMAKKVAVAGAVVGLVIVLVAAALGSRQSAPGKVAVVAGTRAQVRAGILTSGDGTDQTGDTIAPTDTSLPPATGDSTTAVAPRTTGTTATTATNTPGHGTAAPIKAAPSTTQPPPVAVSPTGRLAVTLIVPNHPGSSSGPIGIATMAADGSARRVVATGRYFAPRWTPDGRFVVFSSDSTPSGATLAVAATGGVVTTLADGGGGIVSPDGARLAYNRAGAMVIQSIVETSAGLVASGATTTVAVPGAVMVWSPDGRSLLYSIGMGPQSGLGIVNVDGTNAHDLLAGTGKRMIGGDQPDFSADGATVSFLGSDSVVYFVDADGHNLRPALPEVVVGVSSKTAFSTAWSPGHQGLALLLGKVIVVVDTGSHVVATAHLPYQGSPVGVSFDASGKFLYYMGLVDPTHVVDLYAIATDGTGNRPLTDDGSVSQPPAVAP
jgi:hypothetical protein